MGTPGTHLARNFPLSSSGAIPLLEIEWQRSTLLQPQGRRPLLKVQIWRPDTHPGHVVEVEWEYDRETGRDSGREHRAISVRYPDGTFIHRDTHGADVVQEHYRKLLAEHVVKNRAYGLIVESLPARMKKLLLDGDGDPVLDEAGQPRLTVKAKHKPHFKHLGSGRYEFTVPGIDEATHRDLAVKLTEFGDGVVVLQPASESPQ
ncbi:MAG TPA: hypothetical protein VHY79_07880 [Rhizomicrobium sp.]|jgi:hypothetical protein|nr:hypothetical protein [Rhizomicrobium sp.]